MLKSIIAATVFGLFSVTAAQAVTVTQTSTYIGDVCDDFDSDGGTSGTDFNDCNQAIQNGGPLGYFTMDLLGLNPLPTSSALFTITSSVFDLFNAGGGNNPFESFGFALDSLNFGTLFDGTTSDEAAVNAELPTSVQSNIDASTKSDSPISLSFSLALAEFEPLVNDGKITALFDFGNDSNVNSFRDVSISVTYAAVPLPIGFGLLLVALAGLGFVARRRT